jgi:Dihydrouridine synthase (Dus)
MMDWTDRHCRVFHRLLSRRAGLYTEMLTTGHPCDLQRLLGFDASKHPVALQLGGSKPRELATAASIGEDFGYEINLNVGCPSRHRRLRLLPSIHPQSGLILWPSPAQLGAEALRRAHDRRRELSRVNDHDHRRFRHAEPVRDTHAVWEPIELGWRTVARLAGHLVGQIGMKLVSWI